MIVYMPIKTISESNQGGISRPAGIFKSKRIKRQRSETFYGLLDAWGQCRLSLPLIIIITRVSPRALDTDNLATSLKHIQDGVADWLCGKYGKGQDRQEGLCWEYTQQRGKPGERAVMVTIHHLTQPYGLRVLWA